MHRRRIMFLLLASLASPAVRADEDRGDGERARAAVEAGEIRPLSELLARIEPQYAGRIIETRLERKHGRWIYDFKFLPDAGRIFTVKVDAADGAVLGTHGPVQERR